MLENETLDYKEKFGSNTLKTLSAFVNTNGGTVIVGVSDDGEEKGVDLSNKGLEQITEKIVGKLGIHPSIEIVDLKDEKRKILKIHVERSNVPISFEGKYYKHVGNTTREMKGDELKGFFQRDVNWDSLINDYSIEEIDKDTVKQFIRMAKSIGRINALDENILVEETLKNLKLMEGGKLTNAAIMLFGKDPQEHFINASLRVVRIKGDNTIIGDRLIGGNLFTQFFKGEEAIKNFMNVRYEIKDKFQRDEIWDYPIPAIREALLNALIHRDYFKWNVQTQIKIFDDYIWFYNPGQLPRGITLKESENVHPSVPRNPLVVHVVYLSGLIEELGSGIKRMKTSMKNADLPLPRFEEKFNGFCVYLGKDIYSVERLKEMGLSERQIKAVLYVKENGKITNEEYRKLNNVSKPTATRDLLYLQENGMFKQVGKTGKGTYYILR